MSEGLPLRKRSSLASLSEVELGEILNPKQTTTDRICGIINYISLVPTIVYNSFWIYYIFSQGDKVFSTPTTEDCQLLFNSISSISTWCFLALIKAMFFLFCSKMICGSENDCNVLCLLIKALTSYFPAIYFSYTLDYATFLTPLQIEKCDASWNSVLQFVKFERIYIYFFTSLLALIPIGSILMALKELWKSRKYHEKLM